MFKQNISVSTVAFIFYQDATSSADAFSLVKAISLSYIGINWFSVLAFVEKIEEHVLNALPLLIIVHHLQCLPF